MNRAARGRLIDHLVSLLVPIESAVREISATAAPTLAPRQRVSEAERALMLVDVDRLFPPHAIARANADARRNATHPAVRALIQYQNRMRK